MASVFCCGFECGVTGTLGQHWNLLGTGAASIVTSTKRSGARSIEFACSASHGTLRRTNTSSVFVVRFYVYFSSLPNSNCAIFYSINGVAYPFLGVMFRSSDNSLYAGSNTAANTYAFGATGVLVTTGRWYKIDCKVDVTNNPWTVDAKVDGAVCGQYTNAVAGSTFTNINLGSEDDTTGTFYIDDFTESNTAGDYPLVGAYIHHFIPTADGTHNVAGTADFRRTLTATDILNSTTDAYQLVDDVPLESGASVDWINMLLPVNATDYVECIFGPASGIPTPTVGPKAIEIIAGIHQAGTGNGNMEIRLNDNGSMGTIYTATAVAGVTSVNYKRAHFVDPPSAATAWHALNDGSNGDFRDLRVRFGSPAALDVNPDQYFDCIMIEAEFAEIKAKIVQLNQAIKRSNVY